MWRKAEVRGTSSSPDMEGEASVPDFSASSSVPGKLAGCPPEAPLCWHWFVRALVCISSQLRIQGRDGVAWNLPQWEYLHHGNWQMLQK